MENGETRFTDGSSYVLNGNRHAGYAVTASQEVTESGALPTNTSAQKAEIIALTRALKLAQGKVVNIYTDSKYAFGVVHAHEAIWKERGLVSSQGKNIKQAEEILKLLEAVQFPKKVAIMHIKAHQKVSSDLEKGNELADREAKQVAKTQSLTEKTLELPWEGPFQVLLASFTTIKIKERNTWIHHARVKKAPKGQWTSQEKGPLKLKLKGELERRTLRSTGSSGRGAKD
ncbi:ribonuclease H-like [Accipiter gentilis]|uniref:ribonuclease H-like n=1 Tax=Astur gentilis TaxID=8957 RepID=UPI00210FBB40|nr:ribonuclease H-like [Accipiter gentilis]